MVAQWRRSAARLLTATARHTATPSTLAVDEIFSDQRPPLGNFFSTQDEETWRCVRKATAPAFSNDNLKRSFGRVQQVGGGWVGVHQRPSTWLFV